MSHIPSDIRSFKIQKGIQIKDTDLTCWYKLTQLKNNKGEPVLMSFFRIALKKLAFFVFSNRLRISIRLKKLNSRNLITVVNLHKISSTDNSAYRPMTVQLFEELITFLNTNFSFTSFYNLRNKIHKGKQIIKLDVFDNVNNKTTYISEIIF